MPYVEPLKELVKMPKLPDNIYNWFFKLSSSTKNVITITRTRNNSGYVMTSDQIAILELLELLSSTEEELMRLKDEKEFRESQPIVIAGINSDALKNFIIAVVEDEGKKVEERIIRNLAMVFTNHFQRNEKATDAEKKRVW